MNESKNIKFNKTVQLITKMSLDMASVVFSKLTKTDAKIIIDKIYSDDISNISENMNKNSKEVMASLVNLVGDTPMKFLFMVPLNDSLKLTDLILEKKIGTHNEFNMYVESSVQEIGNIMASAICNVFVTTCKIKLVPAPPIVMKDFSSTIFQEYTFDLAMEQNEMLVVESHFDLTNCGINCSLFLLPYLESNKILSSIEGL
ncbi:MAG: hypothetical protein HQK51_09765 [Oligoflexia bacterium]|nr:hypothetical protein [Oligoflexia bacterium]